MRLLLFILLQFITPPPKAPAPPPKTKAMIANEKKAIKLVKALPEVIYDEKATQKEYKLPLDIEVNDYRTVDNRYYSVEVYRPRPDVGMRNNLYYFDVDIKTNTIRVYDFFVDKTLSLQAWRRLTRARSREYERSLRARRKTKHPN